MARPRMFQVVKLKKRRIKKIKRKLVQPLFHSFCSLRRIGVNKSKKVNFFLSKHVVFHKSFHVSAVNYPN